MKLLSSPDRSKTAGTAHPLAEVNIGLEYFVQELALRGFDPVSSNLPSV